MLKFKSGYLTLMKLKLLLIAFFFGIYSASFAQRSYKELMLDNSVNFYEVCAAADAYFETVDKDAKGSGWKGYQRWRVENESKFYPSGDRSSVDPYMVIESYNRLVLESESDTRTMYSAGWVELGPASIDSITGHYAAGLGRLETFYVNPSDPNVMYVGSRSGGFWKSIDGGTSWTGGTTDFLPASGVNSITVSPTNPDSILINVRNSANGVTHGIYRSIDGGDTWTETNFNPVELDKGGLGSNFSINRVVYHPRVPDLIFVCASDGLYRSDDNLDTWLKVTTGSISDIEFHPIDDDIVYIYDYYYWGTNKNKVLYSLDQGLTFTGSAEIIGNDGNTSVQLDVSPECEDCIYFASGNGIWKSFDKGLTFNFVSAPGTGSQGFAVSDLDSSKMTYGYVDTYASADGGLTFSQVTWWGLFSADHGPGGYQERYQNSEHYVHADNREAECINGVFYVATDGHFGRSFDNGLTWEHLTTDIGIRENYTLGASQSNHFRTIVGSQDNGTSIKHQTTWLEYTGGDGMEGIIHPLNDDWMISSYQYGSRTKTFDGGLSLSGASPPGHSSNWVAPMAYDPNDHHTIYHFGENVHKTTDFTTTWEVVGTPSFTGQILEAAIAENNSNIIIATRQENIERSMDGGVTWEDIQGTLPNYRITDIAFDPLRDSTFVVTYNRWQDDGQKIYITHDLGNTWTNITANLNDMPIRGAVIDHSSSSYIYVAAEIGVFYKAMDATTWELYNDDLPNCSINELEVMYGSNSIRAATWGRGVWEYTLKDRNSYPSIMRTWITDQPTFTTPVEGSEQYVTSLISYDDVISEAYVQWSIDEPIFDNTIAMENTADSTWVSVEPLPDFPPGTKVYFKVFAEGSSSDLTETYKFMYTVQNIEYCESYGSMGYSTAVTLVDFQDLNNPTGKLAPYTSYVDEDTAFVYRTQSYDLTVNMDTDGGYTVHSKAWIDWNRNGDFTDVGEEYDLGTAFDTPDGPSTLSPLSITVPGDAHLGKTTMRVSAKYNSDPTPCETGFDGEVEDYTLFIKPIIDLDFEVDETDLCVGEAIHYMYTGTPLENISWTFSNGIDEYTSTAMSGSVLLSEPGEYSVNIVGFDGIFSIGNTWSSVFTVHPNYNENKDTAICSYEVFNFGTQTLTSPGVYTEGFTSVYGCDSTVSLTLSHLLVDALVIVNDFDLQANESSATYQWLDCNDGWSAIAGATDQTFTPMDNGSYAVIVNDGACIDTSDCYDIVALSSLEPNESNDVIIYPNPSDGEFNIVFASVVNEALVQVFDLSGKLVYANEYSDQSTINFSIDVAPGIYYLTLDGVEEKKLVYKIAIE